MWENRLIAKSPDTISIGVKKWSFLKDGAKSFATILECLKCLNSEMCGKLNWVVDRYKLGR